MEQITNQLLSLEMSVVNGPQIPLSHTLTCSVDPKSYPERTISDLDDDGEVRGPLDRTLLRLQREDALAPRYGRAVRHGRSEACGVAQRHRLAGEM